MKKNGFDVSFGFGCLCRFMEPKKSTHKVRIGNEEHRIQRFTRLNKNHYQWVVESHSHNYLFESFPMIWAIEQLLQLLCSLSLAIWTEHSVNQIRLALAFDSLPALTLSEITSPSIRRASEWASCWSCCSGAEAVPWGTLEGFHRSSCFSVPEDDSWMDWYESVPTCTRLCFLDSSQSKSDSDEDWTSSCRSCCLSPYLPLFLEYLVIILFAPLANDCRCFHIPFFTERH